MSRPVYSRVDVLWPGGGLLRQVMSEAPQEGLTYVQAVAGARHTVLIQSDGRAEARGDNRSGQCDLPALEEGLSHTKQEDTTAARTPHLSAAR